MTYRLGVIGGGNMGGAIVIGGVSAGVIEREDIIIAEIDPRKRALSDAGFTVTDDPAVAVLAETVMLAVKPQAFRGFAGVPGVVEQIGGLDRSKVIISIMAGVHSTRIRALLGDNARVVRVMPNMPCQIGKGMAGIALGDGALAGDEAFALQLFSSIGRAVVVEEALMHAVTAISGSGPAYVFLLAEAMEQAARQLGLSHGTARLLVRQTIAGAAALLDDEEITAADLRQSITSPGGTTAAALEVMFEAGLPQIIADALHAARDRGEELEQG